MNCEWPRIINKQRKVLRRFTNPLLDTPPIDELRFLNSKIEQAAQKTGASVVLLSEENRIGPPMSMELKWNIDRPKFYAHADTCMRYVTHGLPYENMRFVLFSRDPESYIASLYSEAMRLLSTTLDIDDFCRSVDLRSIDFEGLKDRLQSMSPEIEIRMRPFERIKKGARAFLETFVKDLGLEPAPFSFLTQQTRTMLDKSQAEDLRQLAIRQSDQLKPVLVRKFQSEILGRTSDKQDRITLPEWAREELNADKSKLI